MCVCIYTAHHCLKTVYKKPLYFTQNHKSPNHKYPLGLIEIKRNPKRPRGIRRNPKDSPRKSQRNPKRSKVIKGKPKDSQKSEGILKKSEDVQEETPRNPKDIPMKPQGNQKKSRKIQEIPGNPKDTRR